MLTTDKRSQFGSYSSFISYAKKRGYPYLFRDRGLYIRFPKGHALAEGEVLMRRAESPNWRAIYGARLP